MRRRKRAEARRRRGAGRGRRGRDPRRPVPGLRRAACRVDLTRREFELIQLLAEAEGQVLQREEIYQRVWGYAMVHGDRSVDVFVRKLRQKLERASPGWRYIHTHFGIGYRFAAEPVVDEAVATSAVARARPLPRDVTAGRADGAPVVARRPQRPRRRRARRLSWVPWDPTASTCATSRSSDPARGGRLAAAGRRPASRDDQQPPRASCSSAACCSSATGCTWSTAETLFRLEERQRGILYAALALVGITLVATRGCGTRAASARCSGWPSRRSASGAAFASGARTASTEPGAAEPTCSSGERRGRRLSRTPITSTAPPPGVRLGLEQDLEAVRVDVVDGGEVDRDARGSLRRARSTPSSTRGGPRSSRPRREQHDAAVFALEFDARRSVPMVTLPGYVEVTDVLGRTRPVPIAHDPQPRVAPRHSSREASAMPSARCPPCRRAGARRSGDGRAGGAAAALAALLPAPWQAALAGQAAWAATAAARAAARAHAVGADRARPRAPTSRARSSAACGSRGATRADVEVACPHPVPPGPAEPGAPCRRAVRAAVMTRAQAGPARRPSSSSPCSRSSLVVALAAAAPAGQAAAEHAGQAAQAGAMALLQGGDPRAARQRAARWRRSRAEIEVDGRRVTVTVRPRLPIGPLAMTAEARRRRRARRAERRRAAHGARSPAAMSRALERAAGFFLAPPERRDGPGRRCRRRCARSCSGSPADAAPLAAALALSLRLRAPAVVAAGESDESVRPGRRHPCDGAARRPSHHARPARARRGRLAWLALPPEPAAAPTRSGEPRHSSKVHSSPPSPAPGHPSSKRSSPTTTSPSSPPTRTPRSPGPPSHGWPNEASPRPPARRRVAASTGTRTRRPRRPRPRRPRRAAPRA